MPVLSIVTDFDFKVKDSMSVTKINKCELSVYLYISRTICISLPIQSFCKCISYPTTCSLIRMVVQCACTCRSSLNSCSKNLVFSLFHLYYTSQSTIHMTAYTATEEGLTYCRASWPQTNRVLRPSTDTGPPFNSTSERPDPLLYNENIVSNVRT